MIYLKLFKPADPSVAGDSSMEFAIELEGWDVVRGAAVGEAFVVGWATRGDTPLMIKGITHAPPRGQAIAQMNVASIKRALSRGQG